MKVYNWQTGLLRLWVVVSIGWIVLVFSIASVEGELASRWKDYWRSRSYERIVQRIEIGIQNGGLTNNQGEFVNSQQLQIDLTQVKNKQPQVNTQSDLAASWLYRLLALLILPPFGIFVFGRATVWVVNGFKSERVGQPMRSQGQNGRQEN